MFEGLNLASRVRWLVRLRWIAVAAVVLTVSVAAAVHTVEGPGHLYAVAGLLAAANVVFSALTARGRGLLALAVAQVVTDSVALTFLLHYAGGSGNPFAFFFVFHVIIASMLLSERSAWLTAVMSAGLFGGLTWADLAGLCPNHPIIGAPPGPPDRAFALGRLVAFTATMLSSAYFGTTVMRALRAHQSELRESREKLAQSEKLAAIGQLATGIAHELNTPLGSILVASEMVKEAPPGDPQSAELLTDIARETKRCKEITRSLLDLSRKRDLTLATTDPAEVVRQAVGLVKREAGTRAACVEVAAPERLPLVRTDAGALGQVVVNVLKNALDAVEGRPDPRVTVSARGENGSVAIEIGDNGRGIAKADLGRLYEPFFTTKEAGKGTGLGLSLSYAIMRDLRGEIAVESEEGRGTRVRLVIPVKQETKEG